MKNVPDSITIDAPHSDSDWNRSGTRIVEFTRWSRETYQLQRSYPLPLPGWSLAIYYGGTLVDDEARYLAASVSPSGTVCTLVRWVSEDYTVADYLQDSHNTGISPIPSAPELRVVDSRWRGDDVEAYGDYLYSFGIDCAYPADEAYHDRFISCCYDEGLAEDAEGTVEEINLVIREWICLITEAAPRSEKE